MATYRKKPIEIEAIHAIRLHHLAGTDFWKMPKWAIAAYDKGELLFLNHPSRIEIITLEGTMTATKEDMIICGVKGELYPCKIDIFSATYDYVDGQE